MRLLTFRVGDQFRLGALVGESVIDLNRASRAYLGDSRGSRDRILPPDMLSFIDGGDEVVKVAEETLEYCRQVMGKGGFGGRRGILYGLKRVKICAPIPRPRKDIVCLAGNYAEHVKEGMRATGLPLDQRKTAVYFSKPPTVVIGHEDDIEWDDAVTQKVDYEGELAVVIGKRGKNIPAERAYDYVFGYTIMNDVSARDLQRLHEQFYKGKGLDTFGPMGPYLVHKSQIKDPHKLQLTTKVNGEVRQSANTAEMTRHIPELMKILSAGITLEPGDIISTGTCQGVGLAMEPPQFLKDGDVVEVTIEAIGTLRNRVRRV